jgi:putative methyltransferase (TIGR04325 family)
MSPKLRKLARELVPPLVARAISRRDDRNIRFTEMRDWAEARAASSGYDDPAILDKVAAATRKVLAGQAEYERDSVLFDRIEYAWPVLAGLLWAAAGNGGRLSVIDFGGSLGTTYFQNRKFLRNLDVRWNVVEQPHFAARGRAEFEDDRLRFHESVDAARSAGAPDVVLFGGSLQFLERPYEVLEGVTRLPHGVMILDATPFSELDDDRVCVQHVPASIYAASYPSHVFSRAKFGRWLQAHGWTALETFGSLGGAFKADRGLRFAFEGTLLTR